MLLFLCGKGTYMPVDTTLQDRKFKTAFGLIDNNKNGVIGWKDVLRIAERIREGYGWTNETPRYLQLVQRLKSGWEKILQVQDLDRNGTLSYNEYVSLIARIGVEWAVNNALPAWALEIGTALLSVLDVNGDGTYSVKEYAGYLRAIGSDADAKKVFAKLDINKNGKLTFDELLELAKQFATSNDPASPGNYLVAGKF